MRAFQWVAILAILGIATATCKPAHADEYSDTIEVFAKASAAKPFLKSAYGYAVFPTVGKGGFVVGGAYGTGKVYSQGKITGTAKLVKLTIGLQAGGQAFREIVFFQDKRAYEEFTSGNFEFGADASAVVITAGAQASAGTGGGKCRHQCRSGDREAGPDKLPQRHGRFHSRQRRPDV